MVKKIRKRSKKSKKRRSCSIRNKKQCCGDPNCHYVKKRGCIRRKGGVYEGPIIPAYMMI
jgi:hypothetical protein